MNDFNIKEVDFFGLDIDKYINWLLDKYEIFSTLWELPYIDAEMNNWAYRLFKANTHYIMTRGQSIPKHIKTAYERRINHFKEQRGKYAGYHLEVIFFESVQYEKDNARNKEYGFFTKEELKQLSIDISGLKFWLINNNNSGFSSLLELLEDKRKATPLKDKIFYQKELDNLLQSFEFEYLPRILEGQFIYDLDNNKNALTFAVEVDNIRFAIYLTEQIRGEAQKLPIIKPLKWTGDINVLATLFDELLKCGLIGKDWGAKENIKRLLLNNFVNADGGNLSRDYLDEILKPSKMKKDKETADLLNGVLSKLSKNSPQS